MARIEKHVAVFVLLHAHAEMVEQREQEAAEKRIGIRRADADRQRQPDAVEPADALLQQAGIRLSSDRSER